MFSGLWGALAPGNAARGLRTEIAGLHGRSHLLLNVVHFRVPHARSVLQNRDLSPKFFEERQTPPPVTSDDARALSVRVDRPLSEIAQDIEIAALTYALRATNGRMDLAAKRLGLSRKGLYLKRQRLGL